jgi:hypothetical protein
VVALFAFFNEIRFFRCHYSVETPYGPTAPRRCIAGWHALLRFHGASVLACRSSQRAKLAIASRVDVP